MIRCLMALLMLTTLPACDQAFDARADGGTPGDAPAGSVVESVDLAQHFRGLDGSFVLLDGESGRYRVFNRGDAATRHLPASTFKIASTLIALETGVVADVDETRVRDEALAPEQDWWPAQWLQPHSMRSGFQLSTVWLYQMLAREIGELRMLDWLNRLAYGNASIDGGVDRFWLSGGLRISGFEQVDFLRRLHEGELPVSDSSREAVAKLMAIEHEDGVELGGKTGWTGVGEDGTGVGWFVGHVQVDGTMHYFATRIDATEGTDLGERLRITRAALAELLDAG